MLTKILSRGGRASGYLGVRFLVGLGILVALPLGLLFSWVPAVRAGLVRLAKSERSQASRYLDLPAEPGGSSFKRSLWLLWMPLLGVPELFVAAFAVLAVPAALAGMALWQLAPGGFSLMGVGVDNWFEALTIGPAQILVGLAMLRWGAPAVARRHARNGPQRAGTE